MGLKAGVYHEHTSASGAILRVSREKGSFLIIKSGEPVHNPVGGGKSIVFDIPNVIFVGTMFELPNHELQEVNFVPVDDMKMDLSFKYRTMSDVRHVLIQVPVDVDVYPIAVFHLPGLPGGIVPKGYTGLSYFIIDPMIEKDATTRVRMNYPDSSIAVMSTARETVMPVVQKLGVRAGDQEHVRAADVMATEDVGELSENPTFVARVYLRKLEWDKMRDIPFRLRLMPEDAQGIVAFLDVMIKKSVDVPELKEAEASLKTLFSFYGLLAKLLNPDEAMALVESDGVAPALMPAVKKVLESQLRMRSAVGQENEGQFISKVLSKLDPANSDT